MRKLLKGHIESVKVAVTKLYIRMHAYINGALRRAFVGIAFLYGHEFLNILNREGRHLGVKIAPDTALLHDIVKVLEPADDIDQFHLGNRHILKHHLCRMCY